MVFIEGHGEFEPSFLSRLLSRFFNKNIKITDNDILDARVVYSTPLCKSGFRNVGGYKFDDQEYVCVSVGRKYVHLYYRTPHHYSAAKNRVYYFYFRFPRTILA